MIIQRKRVAKRLASGLLAGALALGGLAISGASPVSANAPTTARYSGLDRYSTSVEIARAIGSGHTSVVIASGQDANLADALGASALNVPILLANADGLPGSVANYLSNPGNVAATATFTIVGGASAVGSTVEAELAALGFLAANIKRVSGDTRYDTAIEISKISGVTGNNDELIIASGENDHLIDAVAASTLAAQNGWPVLLSGPNGLSAATQARIKAILATPGVTIPTIHILGGTSAVPSVVEEQLTGADVGYKPSKLNRIAGASRYATAALVATVIDGIAGFDGETMLLNGTNPVDALVAGPLGAAKDWIPVLTPGDALGADAQAQIVKATGVATNDVTAIGGTTAIAPGVLTAASTASKDAADVTPFLSVIENSTSFTVSFFPPSGNLGSELDCDSSAGGTAFDASFKINGSLNTSFAGNAVTASGGFGCEVTVSRTSPFTAGTTIEYLGHPEESSGASVLRSLQGSSWTVEDDQIKPTVELAGVRAVEAQVGVSDGYTVLYFKPSEALADVLTGGEVKVYSALDASDGSFDTDLCKNDFVGLAAGGNPQNHLAYGCSSTDNSVDDAALAISSGDVVVISAGALVDLTGNTSDQQIFVVDLDETGPNLASTQFSVGQSTAGVFSIETGLTDITLTVGEGSVMAGHVAQQWRIALLDSSATVPMASIDLESKLVTLSFNFLTHDGDDIIWSINRNSEVKNLGTWAGGSDGKVKGYISGDKVSTSTASGVIGTSSTFVFLSFDSLLLSTTSAVQLEGSTCTPTTSNISLPGGSSSFVVRCSAIASGLDSAHGQIQLGNISDLNGNQTTGIVVEIP